MIAVSKTRAGSLLATIAALAMTSLPTTALVLAAGCGDKKPDTASSESGDDANQAPDESAAQDDSDDDDDDRDDGDDDGDDDAHGVASRVEHTVFDLGDNRLLAHARHRGALHIAAGSAGFAKYVRFGLPQLRWKIGQVVDGVRVAVPTRLASMEIPLGAEEAAAADVLIARIHSGREREMTVKINGRPPSDRRGASSVSLGVGWQTVVVPIDAGRLVAGENFFAFSFSKSKPPALAWLRVGRLASLAAGAARKAAPGAASGEAGAGVAPEQTDGDDGDAHAHGGSPLASYRAGDHTFVLGPGDGLTYHLYVPETGHLVAGVTQGGSEGSGAPSCEVKVRLRAAGIDLESSLSGGQTEGRNQADGPGGKDSRVDLHSFAGRVVQLDLVADASAAACSAVEVRRPRITVAGEAPAGAPRTSSAAAGGASSGTGAGDGAAPRYIVLWVMDTLRADRVRPFQPGARAEVPNLERLALTGAVFRQYYVQGNESQTSHSSIWTSLYPVMHNVRTAGDGGTWRLDARFATLPALLRDAGFYNIGVTANGRISKKAGYGKHFDVWRNPLREGLHTRYNVPAEMLLELGLKHMAERYKEGPVFLFIGTIDNHKPWIARKPWIDRYDTEPYDGPHKDGVFPAGLGMAPNSMRCDKMPTPRDLARINAIYDSDISYQDDQLGKLYRALEDWGIARETLIIVTADHGEEMWEHGICGHGATLRETVLRVPLLMHYPARIPGGQVIDEGADGVDLLPTVLDALGRPALERGQGESLIPLTRGVGRGYPRPSFASQYQYAYAMRIGPWKARISRAGVAAIYNVVDDPLEKRELTAERPIERRFLTDALSIFMVYRRQWKKRDWGVVSNMSPRAAMELDGVTDDERGSASDGDR